MIMRDDELLHYNVKGTNWYVHKYGNWERHAKYANGQPNPDTRIKRNVFISGTSKLKLEGSEFYRKSLPREVRKKVDEYIRNKDHIIIGDAPGIDTEVQRYLAKKKYKDVTVYTIGKHPRAYFDEDKSLGWTVKKVKSETGDQADKDRAMSDDADIGFAVTIEDGAKATRNNVKRMEDDGKNVEVFSLYKNGKDAWEKSNKQNEKDKKLARKHAKWDVWTEVETLEEGRNSIYKKLLKRRMAKGHESEAYVKAYDEMFKQRKKDIRVKIKSDYEKLYNKYYYDDKRKTFRKKKPNETYTVVKEPFSKANMLIKY